ncbi:MAG: PLP-dependent lyase/thiolase [Candidatus Micrarchaeota archaeon]
MKKLHITRTPLVQSRELCGRCNGANVFVKREDAQPSGTTKWRRCAALLESRGDKETVFVHISSGNSGYSMGMVVQQSEDPTKKVVNIVDKRTPEEIKKRLMSCSIVVEMDLSKELITEDRMKEVAIEATGYTGSNENIVIVERYQLEGGYRGITDEIAKQLHTETQGKTNRPDVIFCPVGSGETMVELAARVHEVWKDNPPKIVGVTVPGNYIAARYFSGQEGAKSTGRSIADKLTCAYSAFAELAVRTLNSGAKLMVMNDEDELRRSYKWLNSIGIPVEPSAAVAFLGAMNYSRLMCAEEKDGLTAEKTIVIINTGKGVFDQKAVDRIWLKRLRAGAIYLGVAALGAVLATIAYFGWIAPRQQLHDMFRGKLEAEALMYGNDKTRKGSVYMGFLDKEEIAAMCATVPGKKCDPDSRPNKHDLRDFTDKELAFYIEYKRYLSFSGFSDTELAYFVERRRWEMEGDGLGARIAGDLHYAYEHGRFELRDNKAIWWYQNNEGRWFRYDGKGNMVWEDEEQPKDQWDRMIQNIIKK